MNKKITALVLMAAAWVIFLPSQSSALTIEEKTNSVKELTTENNLVVQQRRWGNRRMNNRRWNNRRWNNGNRRNVRVVRQYYYRNGRRYVRTVRVYR